MKTLAIISCLILFVFGLYAYICLNKPDGAFFIFPAFLGIFCLPIVISSDTKKVIK